LRALALRTKFYQFEHRLSPAIVLSHIYGRRGQKKSERVGEREQTHKRYTNEYTNVADREAFAEVQSRFSRSSSSFAFLSAILCAGPIRKFAGFLLFSRRVPLCTPDKAPRRRPRCFIRDIWQYPNERSTGETTWGEIQRGKAGRIKKQRAEGERYVRLIVTATGITLTAGRKEERKGERA